MRHAWRDTCLIWQVSIAEAKDMLQAWYADRPEVRSVAFLGRWQNSCRRVSLRACLIWQVLDWQQRTIEHARQTGHTRTLMGRYRELPGIGGRTPALRAHAERAAINTPIQGGAADVMTLAMLKLDRSEKLKQLGFKMLLQASDPTVTPFYIRGA